MEVVQVSFSMLTLSSKVISTYQKSITTQQIFEGELEDHERFRLPCCVQVSVEGKGSSKSEGCEWKLNWMESDGAMQWELWKYMRMYNKVKLSKAIVCR